VSDDRTTVDARVEWGNRWPDGEVEVEYGVSCPGCGWPGYMGPDDSARERREWQREADRAVIERRDGPGPCGCHCHKRLDEWDQCPICTSGYSNLCEPP
jgi:hypothetical protein